MTTAVILGLGPGLPNALSLDAIHRLADAHVLLVDADVDSACWGPHLAATATVQTIDRSEPEAEQRARTTLVAHARDGRRVVRARASDGWRSAAALRDVLALRNAGVEVEVVPGIDADAGAWQAWLASHPLFGRRVVVTRMRDQASETARSLAERGADPWVMPTIELRPSPEPERFDAALRALRSYRLVAFTSANGVEQTFERLGALGKDARELGGCLVAAIGTATARALRERGILADVVAKEFRGEQLAAAILERLGGDASPRVLVPRAAEAREILPDTLREAGCEVDVVPAYETVAPSPDQVEPLRAALEQGRIDAVLLTSSSTVKNLCSLLGEGYAGTLSRTVLASIGPITTETARTLGLQVGVEAQQYTIPGLIEALERRFSP